MPYEPWIEVCSQLVEHAPQELLAAALRASWRRAQRLVGTSGARVEGAPPPQASDPETERYLLFSAVADCLRRSRRRAGVRGARRSALADGQSVALLKHVVRTRRATGAAGDRGLPRLRSRQGPSARRRARGPPAVDGVQRMALHGLGSDEVAQVMTSVAGHELDDDGPSAGAGNRDRDRWNPFFVGEILRGLRESGGSSSTRTAGAGASTARARSRCPRACGGHRARAWSAWQRDARALTLAAVIGRVFDVDLLPSRCWRSTKASCSTGSRRRCRLAAGGVRRASRALSLRARADQPDAVRGSRRHPPSAHAPACRRALEELYGEDQSEHLGELALHWRMAAVSVDKAKAAGYALRAGQQALSSASRRPRP